MFAAVMSDPEICRRVLELALGILISEVHIQTEKTMAYHSEYHGFVWMFMLQFLDYVKNTERTEGILTTNSFVRHLQDSIDKIKQNRGMEERYMLLEEMMRNEKREGKLEGNIERKQEFLLTALESKFSVPSELKEKIMSETDIEKFALWFQLSLKAHSLEEFKQNM